MKHTGTSSRKSIALLAIAGSAAGAISLCPGDAQAQFVDRLSLHLEGGVALMLTKPQSENFGLGLTGSARLGLQIAGPLSIHAIAGHWRWGVSNTGRAAGLETGTLTAVGGGLRFGPTLSPSAGRIFVDIEAGLSLTGSESKNRLYLGAGVGYLFPLGSWLEIGPVVRYGHVRAASTEAIDQPGGTGDAQFVTLGLQAGLHRNERAPEGPVDTDRDGVMDPEDQCPTVPMGDHPDPARRGCPAQDTDGDGVFDPEDQCPTQPMGDHPDPARRGCPLADQDGDGIYDPDDRCPTEPEDRDNFEDTDGCPDPDNDRDTILDAQDRCPNEPETRNNFQDEDGCPDVAPPTATVETNRININERIYFDLDRDTIQARSFPILDAVVQVLTGHPEIRRIRIEGNADERGSPEHNLSLSRRRAEAVRNYIQAHGVNRRRLTFVGYGSTRPLAQGDTEEAHAQNRRVDFIIVDGPGAGGSNLPGGPGASATPAPGAAPEARAPRRRRPRPATGQ